MSEMTMPALRTVVALTPEQMTESQGLVRGWCSRKLKEVADDKLELESQESAGAKYGFDVATIRRRLTKNRYRREFYEKVQAAIEAGYVIVPNFPMTLFAVRVTAGAPKTRIDSTREWVQLPDERSALAASGEGRYVSNSRVLQRTGSYNVDEGEKTITNYWKQATDFMEPDFPLALAKPQIIEATGEAMKKLVFDELGIVDNSTSTPSLRG